MNGITNKNQLTIVKEYEFSKPPIHKIDSIVDKCYRDCPNKLFHILKINVNMILNLQKTPKLK